MLAKSTPQWFYWSALPGVGWLALLWAGHRIGQRDWMAFAMFYGALAIMAVGVPSLSGLLTVSWLAGMIHLALVRNRYLMQYQLLQPGASIHTAQEVALAQEIGITVDLNRATQHELVHRLNLPITQANRILELRKGGIQFTSIEDLSAYTGITLTKLRQIAPLIRFCYYEESVGHERWTRVNTLSATAIAREFELSLELSTQVVQERDRKGAFESLADLRQRTQFPYDQLGRLL